MAYNKSTIITPHVYNTSNRRDVDRWDLTQKYYYREIIRPDLLHWIPEDLRNVVPVGVHVDPTKIGSIESTFLVYDDYPIRFDIEQNLATYRVKWWKAHSRDFDPEPTCRTYTDKKSDTPGYVLHTKDDDEALHLRICYRKRGQYQVMDSINFKWTPVVFPDTHGPIESYTSKRSSLLHEIGIRGQFGSNQQWSLEFPSNITKMGNVNIFSQNILAFLPCWHAIKSLNN